jgi:hypothetical protein
LEENIEMTDFIWKIEDKVNLVRFKTLYKNNILKLLNNLFVFGSEKHIHILKKTKISF